MFLSGCRRRSGYAGYGQGMAKNPVIFSMANPTPEIMPDEARKAGAKVIGNGRSDYANQINNVLAFSGISAAHWMSGRVTSTTQ